MSEAQKENSSQILGATAASLAVSGGNTPSVKAQASSQPSQTKKEQQQAAVKATASNITRLLTSGKEEKAAPSPASSQTKAASPVRMSSLVEATQAQIRTLMASLEKIHGENMQNAQQIQSAVTQTAQQVSELTVDATRRTMSARSLQEITAIQGELSQKIPALYNQMFKTLNGVTVSNVRRAHDHFSQTLRNTVSLLDIYKK